MFIIEKYVYRIKVSKTYIFIQFLKNLHCSRYLWYLWSSAVRMCDLRTDFEEAAAVLQLLPVLLFSKLDNIFVEYFDPDLFF